MVHTERWNFFNTVPHPQESTSDYVNRLVNVAVDCDFENFSIKGAIMQNLMAHSLVPNLRKAILEDLLDIDKTLVLATKMEAKCAPETTSIKIEVEENLKEKCETDDKEFSFSKMDIIYNNKIKEDYDDDDDHHHNGEQIDGEWPDKEKKKNIYKMKSVDAHLKKLTDNNITLTKKSSIFSVPLIESHLKRGLTEIENDEFSKLLEEGRDMDIYIKIWGHWAQIRNWECASCSHQITGKITKYDDHFKEVHGIRSIYKCEICGEITDEGSNRYRGRKKFIAHLNSHLVEYLCTAPDSLCEFSSSSKAELNEHLEKVHQIKTGYKCEDCDKVFENMSYLKNHRNKIHKPHRSVTCDICGKTYPRESNLKVHMKLVHTDNKKWPCEICGKESCSKSALQIHVNTVHAEDRKFLICDFQNCERSFLSSRGLSLHKQTEHSDVREHVCQVCGNGYKLIKLLKQHLLVHQTDTPFSCEQCGKGFKTKNRLGEHMHIHTGKLPYECGYCGRRIRSLANIYHHLKHHRDQNHPLEREKEYFKVE